MTWRTIESAPKGESVLIWGPSFEGACGVTCATQDEDGTWEGDGIWTDPDDLDCQPTHWQPLPPPPDAPAVTDEMVLVPRVLPDEAGDAYWNAHAAAETVIAGPDEVWAALLAALQPPDQ